jgi:hypothetical protein
VPEEPEREADREAEGPAVRRSLLPAVALLLAAAAAAGEEPAPAPKPAENPPAEKPAEEKPAAKEEPGAKAVAVVRAKDLEGAKAAAKAARRRIVVVAVPAWYESEPSRRIAKALQDDRAVDALGGFVLLEEKEKADLALSKALGLEDLGHPYTAILDEEGRVLASLRGAFDAAAWAGEVRRLAVACDAVAARRAALAKAPGEPKALWELSEALREAGRVREADETLARAENADADGKSGLLPLFRFRRLEARVEDRMAVQDFEGVKTLVDAYDREFPGSPRRPWVALYRALARAYRGETDAALEDLREVAAGAKGKDESLRVAAEARIAALEKVIERRK